MDGDEKQEIRVKIPSMERIEADARLFDSAYRCGYQQAYNDFLKGFMIGGIIAVVLYYIMVRYHE